MRYRVVGPLLLIAASLVGCASVVTDTQKRNLGLHAGQQVLKITGERDEIEKLSLTGDFVGEMLTLRLQQTIVTRESYQVTRPQVRDTKVSVASGTSDLEQVKQAAELGLEQEPGVYYLGQVRHALFKNVQFKLFRGSAAENEREVGVVVSIASASIDPLIEQQERISARVERPAPGCVLTVKINRSSISVEVTLDAEGLATVDLSPLMKRYAAGRRSRASWLHPTLTVSAKYKGRSLERALYPPPSISFKYKKQHQAQPLIQFCEKLASTLLASVSKAQPRVVAMDFNLSSGAQSQLPLTLGHWVGRALKSHSKVGQLIERQTVIKALSEGGFEGAVGRQGARSIGQHLQAAAVLIGTIRRKGDRYIVSVTLFSSGDDVDLAAVEMTLPGSPYLSKLFKQKPRK